MPVTPLQTLFWVALLVPGFTYHAVRRQRVPHAHSSALSETASFLSVSVLCSLFSLLVHIGISQLPSLELASLQGLLTEPATELARAPTSAVGLLATLLATAVAAAVGLAMRPPPIEKALGRLAPPIRASSAWHEAFEAVPNDHYIIVGCELKAGGFLSGTLAWYSTDVNETGDRSLLLGPPFDIDTDTPGAIAADAERVVLSAADIRTLAVSYVRELE